MTVLSGIPVWSAKWNGSGVVSGGIRAARVILHRLIGDHAGIRTIGRGHGVAGERRGDRARPAIGNGERIIPRTVGGRRLRPAVVIAQGDASGPGVARNLRQAKLDHKDIRVSAAKMGPKRTAPGRIAVPRDNDVARRARRLCHSRGRRRFPPGKCSKAGRRSRLSLAAKPSSPPVYARSGLPQVASLFPETRMLPAGSGVML